MCLFHIFVQTICDQYDIVPIMVGRLHSEHTRVSPILLPDNKLITTDNKRITNGQQITALQRRLTTIS